MQARAATLVVAGVSVRALVESARQAGWQAIALDLFGDADTRRASRRWHAIGEPGSLAIDASRLRAALAEAAGEPGVIGWVAGSGFDGAPELLAAAPAALPLLGMPPHAVRAVRDVQGFVDTLARLGLACPETRLQAPADPHGWLVKHAGGSGGWHIRPAGAEAGAEPGAYYQRRQAGTPMSALFLADGRRACRVALNRLIVGPLGARPFVYRGAVGPIREPGLEDCIDRALAALVPAFALRGLASLDFIAAPDGIRLLEINPRPSGSMVLHAHAWPAGLLRAHVQAVQGRLPIDPPRHRAGLRGTEVVFAPQPLRLGAALAGALGAMADCHDLPDAGTRFVAGDPVCSVTAEAADAAALDRALADRVRAVQAMLEANRQDNEETVQ